MKALITIGILFLLLSAAGSCYKQRPEEIKHSKEEPKNRSAMELSAAAALEAQWRSLAGKTGWKKYPGNPILSPGGPDEWDRWAIMSMTVVRAGGIFHLYYEGGRTGVGDLRIGHARSLDGLHWVKDPCNPVLKPGRPLEWDDGAVWDPFVLYEDGIFKMWYGGERARHKNFQCGYAVSTDGRHFTKKGRISNFDTGWIADIHVVHDEPSNQYYLYHWDWGHYDDIAERLRLVVSNDETGFDFKNSIPIRIKGEQPGHQYTHVFTEDPRWYMYYGFEEKARTGYATSSDGVHWAARNTTLMGTEDAEILKVADKIYFMFYCPEGFQDEADCDIRLAIYNGELDDL